MCTYRKAESDTWAIERHPDVPRDALIDAAGNPRPVMSDRFEPQYHPIPPHEDRVATSVMVLAIAAMLGLVLAFAIDSTQKPMQNTAMNEDVSGSTAQR